MSGLSDQSHPPSTSTRTLCKGLPLMQQNLPRGNGCWAGLGFFVQHITVGDTVTASQKWSVSMVHENVPVALDFLPVSRKILCTGLFWRCCVVWCGVVWCGVVWCGVVWCGVVWCGVVWCGVVWCAEGAVTKRQKAGMSTHG